MGLFLSLSGVIGRNQTEVVSGLKNYAESLNGGFEHADIDGSHKNCCALASANGNTAIFYPAYFNDWDGCSQFISAELGAPVFSCHIHDGDLWMYTLYVNGEIADQFNPIPDYWDEAISDEERESWQGNASIIAKHVPGIKAENIEKYLVTWDLDADEEKAYPEDEYPNCDWQLTDFLSKLKLPYPFDDDAKPKGTTFKMWTAGFPLNNKPLQERYIVGPVPQKPWWKFW